MTDTVLRILSAKTSDSGRYRCRLRTGAGAVLFSLTANLVVAARQGEARQGLSPFDWAGAPRGRQPAMPSRYGDIPRSGQTTQHSLCLCLCLKQTGPLEVRDSHGADVMKTQLKAPKAFRWFFMA